MPFPSALSSGNYDSLRGTASIPPTYQANQYMVLGANTNVFVARVNQATFADSFAQVTYDTVTVGAFGDIETGMTVLLSRTNDRRAAYFVGRVRKTPTSTILYINETSVDVDDNDFLFVLRDYRLFGKLGLESGGVYKKDFDITFAQPGPLIYNLQSAYAGVVSGSPAGYTVAFAPLAIGVASGATISSYAWTIPAGGTITVGGPTTQNITVRFDAAAAEYWVKLIVTDSGGRTSTRRFPVWAIPADLSTTIALGFEGANIEGTVDGGYSASVRAFTGVGTLLDNTLCALVNVERYNTTETNIVSNIAFTGRIRVETDRTAADAAYSVLQELTYEIEGIGAQLARVASPSIYMRDKTAPTVWDEIKDLTFWRAMWYLLFHSTYHELHSLSFDDTGTTFRYLQLQTQGGNLFDAVTDFAQSITATFEFAPQGDARVNRNLNYGTTAQRNAGVTVANFTNQDWLAFTLSHEHIETVGAVGGDGGCFNTVSKKVLALLGNAPKVAQGNAEGTSTLSRQVLTANLSKADAKAELSARLGHHYAFANPNDELTLDFPDGYHWLTPSFSQWYTFTIAASEDTGGRAYTTADRWCLTGVSVEHDNGAGAKRVSANFRLESEGTPGTAYEPPAPAQISLNLPAIPPIPPFPPLGTPPDVYLPPNPDIDDIPPVMTPPFAIAADGNTVLYTTKNGAWLAHDFLASSEPTWIEVTPGDVAANNARACIFGKNRDAYFLESNGSVSRLWYTADVHAGDVAWTAGESVAGEYTSIRLTNTASGVYILGAVTASSPFSYDFDFTENDGDWNVYVAGNYIAGTGWSYADYSNIADRRAVQIFFTLPATSTITAISMRFDRTFGPWDMDGLASESITGNTEAITFAERNKNVAPEGTDLELAFVGSQAGVTRIEVYAASSRQPLSSGIFGGSVVITRIGITGTTGAASGLVRYSSNNGLVWSAPYSPSIGGGLDVIKIGDGALTGNAVDVMLADNDDVVFVAYGSDIPTGAAPTCIFIPRLTFSGGSNINTDTPVYLLASADISASNQTLWQVTASGTTYTDKTPTVGSDEGEAVSPECIAMAWSSSSRIAYIALFAATVRLFTTSSGGTVWSNRGALSATARCVRFRKADKRGQQLFFTNGAPGYSPDFGANLYLKSHPDPSGATLAPGLLIDVYST